MASSSTSSIRKNFKYHVFISFRGEDTRKTYVDHLYACLLRKGIRTFRDNEELEKGKRIDELFKAIEESKFFIIVFSQNYASSSWCLRELAKIMECQDGNQQIAFPIFYDVEPSNIRYQTGPVGRAISKHKTNEHFKEWEKALKDAGNLVGWDLEKIADGHEAAAMDQIVTEISLKLRAIHLSKDENLVGMDRRMQDLETSLRMDLDDEVRMIGIWGMGGAGKTTLARAIFQQISTQFEGISFVDNVRDASKAQGLLSLQKQVLRDVFRDGNVNSVQEATSMMKDRMPLKKVLLVLDDVDHKNQLEALAGDLEWFQGGSRVIITSRNKQVLKAHRVSWIHDIDFLLDEEAISLFNRYAFERYLPIEGYEDLSLQIVNYAAGLPLTLKVLGSSLLGKKEAAWIDTLKRLETIPEKETLDKLEISYDGLEKDQKEIFLDVACFLKGRLKREAIIMLESRGFHAITGLTVLEEQSLITFDSEGYLDMHDSIRELGRNIVRREHPDEPKKHSRLYIKDEIEELLSDDEVTEGTATCLSVSLLDLHSEIIMKGLRKLKNLRLIHISGRYNDFPRDNWMFDQDSFPNSLQFLDWFDYPGRSLPQTFRATKLVGLELVYSNITKLWESGEREVLKKLRFLNLSFSKLRTLDLGMTPNLERLELEGCEDLTDIHAPAGCLKRIVYLNLNGCSSFRSSSFIQQLESAMLGNKLLSLPKLLVHVERLTYDNEEKLCFECSYVEEQASSLENSEKSLSLDLQPGKKFESVSGSFFHLQHLRHLTFNGPIPKLPNDLDQLTYLEELNLVNTDIKSLPDCICMMRHLKSLKLEYGDLLEELPKDLGRLECLEKLSVSFACITHVPDSICMLKNLKSLKLEYCKLLEELPKDLGRLDRLEKLSLESLCITHVPDSICMLKNLKSLKLEYCKLLEELPKDLGRLDRLEKLSLESLCITHVPDSICMLKNLKSLKLEYCKLLEELPKDLGRLDRLEKLSLESLCITHVPDSICMLKNLKSLKLRDCELLEELPRDLGQLECLEELILEWCRSLRHIPNSISNMKRLKELNIEGTGIGQLPQSISSLVGLRVFGSLEALQSCAAFATEIETETETEE